MEITDSEHIMDRPAAPASPSPTREALLKGLCLAGLLSLVIFINSSFLQDGIYSVTSIFSRSHLPSKEATQKEYKQLERTVRELKRKYETLIPRGRYLVINTTENVYSLKSGKKVLHEGRCSTGSYILLKAYDNSAQWTFKTPRGLFRVGNIIEKPVWRMPDWAFIEEGLPVPPKHSLKRYEFGVLGDWALDIGRGYLIHGTLYQRFLGLPVTHGCIRLGDEDLQIVIHNMSIGSKVFIY